MATTTTKTNKPTQKKTTKRAPLTYAILANDRYGLYAGLVQSYDPVTRVAVVAACRHVARWHGKTGGITSLAAHGLCGPNGPQSRIGAPTSEPSTLTGIINVFPCSAAARTSIEGATQS
jgi:hypothetical protein